MPACLACPCAARDHRLWRDAHAHLELQHHQYDQPEQERRGEQIEGQQVVWREPRQPSSFPLRIASPSTSQSPLQTTKVEPVVGGASNDGDEGGGGYSSDITLPSSNDPQSSSRDPRNGLPEAKKDDKPFEASSCNDYERASIEVDRTNSCGTDTFEQGDLDFKYVFADFKQALSHSGQAVAETWSSDRLLAEPELVTDEVIVDATNATATNISESNQKCMEAGAKKKVERTPFLRQPGRVSKSEEQDSIVCDSSRPFQGI